MFGGWTCQRRHTIILEPFSFGILSPQNFRQKHHGKSAETGMRPVCSGTRTSAVKTTVQWEENLHRTEMYKSKWKSTWDTAPKAVWDEEVREKENQDGLVFPPSQVYWPWEFCTSKSNKDSLTTPWMAHPLPTRVSFIGQSWGWDEIICVCSFTAFRVSRKKPGWKPKQKHGQCESPILSTFFT